MMSRLESCLICFYTTVALVLQPRWLSSPCDWGDHWDRGGRREPGHGALQLWALGPQDGGEGITYGISGSWGYSGCEALMSLWRQDLCRNWLAVTFWSVEKCEPWAGGQYVTGFVVRLRSMPSWEPRTVAQDVGCTGHSLRHAARSASIFGLALGRRDQR